MLAKPGLSDAQRASILKIQGRRAARKAKEDAEYQQKLLNSETAAHRAAKAGDADGSRRRCLLHCCPSHRCLSHRCLSHHCLARADEQTSTY